MAKHGHLREYDNTREDWLACMERLQHYFAANDVRNAEKQRAILLSSVGSSIYQLMKSLLAPTKPSEKKFDELVRLVQDHYQPPPSESVQRYRFNIHSRKQGVSIAATTGTGRILQLRGLVERDVTRSPGVWC